MKPLIFLAAMFAVSICCTSSHAQDVNRHNSIPVKTAFETTEITGFPGGKVGLEKYLHRHIEYPMLAREMQVEGKVWVQFRISHEGDISAVHVLEGLGFGCDEAVVAAVKKMPQWRSGGLHDSVPQQQVLVPVNFKLTRGLM